MLRSSSFTSRTLRSTLSRLDRSLLAKSENELGQRSADSSPSSRSFSVLGRPSSSPSVRSFSPIFNHRYQPSTLNTRQRSSQPLPSRQICSPTPAQEAPFERLPLDIHPEVYNLKLTLLPTKKDETNQPHLSFFRKFSGEVTIELLVKTKTKRILLNAADLTMSDVVLHREDGKLERPDTISTELRDEKIILDFPTSFQPGEKMRLWVSYKGKIGDDMKGLYRSTYQPLQQDSSETKTSETQKELAVTQFEPTDARRVVPCWDEPNFRSVYRLTLVIPDSYQAVANMPVSKERTMKSFLPIYLPAENKEKHEEIHALVQEDQKNLEEREFSCKEIVFQDTPSMPSYLLAFAVGDFQILKSYYERPQDLLHLSKNKNTHSKVELRLIAPRGRTSGEVSEGEYGLEVSRRCLEFYEKYFNILYPLPKLDQISIPDFAAGAMENWGLITYRESALLYSKSLSSYTSKVWISLVIAHEIAHQWFGNLVTMQWWTHLWLNEGFASWIENHCVDKLFPEMNIWKRYIYSNYDRALRLDSLTSSHPIEVSLSHPKQIDEIFDAISYSKGSVVIRMLQNILGEKQFRERLGKYLEKYKYSYATTEDLWEALSTQNENDDRSIDVKLIMDTWTKQTGYPVLFVEEVQSSKAEKVFRLTQKRFLSRFSTDNEAADPSLWKLPISYLPLYPSSSVLSSHQDVHYQIMGDRSIDLTVPLSSSSSSNDPFVFFNPGRIAFCRVCYSPSLISKFVNSQAISDLHDPIDRLTLINDSFAFVQNGTMKISQLLSLLTAFQNQESDWAVWSDISINLNNLRFLFTSSASGGLRDDVSYLQFSAFCRNLYSKVNSELKVSLSQQTENDDKKDGKPQDDLEKAIKTEFKSTILRQLVEYSDQQTIQEMYEKYFDILYQDVMSRTKNSNLAPEFREIVYRSAVKISIKQERKKNFEKLLEMYEKVEFNEEKVRILRALGAGVVDAELAGHLVEMALDAGRVKKQDGPSLLASLSHNQSIEGRRIVWREVERKWNYIIEHFKGFLLNSIVMSTLSPFSEQQQIDQIQQFFEMQRRTEKESAISGESSSLAGIDRTIGQSLETARSRASFAQHCLPEFKEWLHSQKF